MTQRWIFAFTCYCLAGCASVESLPAEGSDQRRITFRMIGNKIPMIQARLNNRPAWFIVDTGASITLLNATESLHFEVAAYKSSREATELSGFSNRFDISLTAICRLEIGNLLIRHRVYVSNEMDRLFEMIEKHERIRVAGILGSDILARYLMNINYGTRTLSYIIR